MRLRRADGRALEALGQQVVINSARKRTHTRWREIGERSSVVHRFRFALLACPSQFVAPNFRVLAKCCFGELQLVCGSRETARTATFYNIALATLNSRARSGDALAKSIAARVLLDLRSARSLPFLMAVRPSVCLRARSPLSLRSGVEAKVRAISRNHSVTVRYCALARLKWQQSCSRVATPQLCKSRRLLRLCWTSSVVASFAAHCAPPARESSTREERRSIRARRRRPASTTAAKAKAKATPAPSTKTIQLRLSLAFALVSPLISSDFTRAGQQPAHAFSRISSLSSDSTQLNHNNFKYSTTLPARQPLSDH